MNLRSYRLSSLIPLLILVAFSGPTFAYVGPGAGLSAIGTIVALVLVVVVGLAGFLWYPLKRLFGKKSSQHSEIVEDDTDLPAGSAGTDK